MLAPRGGPTFMEIDWQASTKDQPHLMVTADCSNPKELDDGLFVEPLPSAQEMYRVGVCVVDTSPLYRDSGVLSEVMTRTEAKYYDLPGEEQGYEPMIGEDIIRDLDFRIRKPGDTRSAMVVRFVIGEHQAPTDVEVVFGQVEMTDNHDYRDFASRCREGETYERFGRTAAFIRKHLGYTPGGDYDTPVMADDDPNVIYRQMVSGPAHQGYLRGSRMNEAFMVGAGHLVGRLIASEDDRIAIYRVHNPADETLRMFLPANVATYSWEPGRHDGLGLYPFCRVTSPLRRAEDFFMSHLLRQRHDGQPVMAGDEQNIALAVRRLNARIMDKYAGQPMRHAREQTPFGRNRRMLGSAARAGAAVVSLHAASA